MINAPGNGNQFWRLVYASFENTVLYINNEKFLSFNVFIFSLYVHVFLFKNQSTKSYPWGKYGGGGLVHFGNFYYMYF